MWWTFRVPSLCRHVHRALWRSVLLDVPPIIAATACHQRNYVERYSRYKTLADYFSTLTHAGFTTMPEVHELGVTDEHLQLDPAFFGPLVDQPLQVAFRLVR